MSFPSLTQKTQMIQSLHATSAMAATDGSTSNITTQTQLPRLSASTMIALLATEVEEQEQRAEARLLAARNASAEADMFLRRALTLLELAAQAESKMSGDKEEDEEKEQEEARRGDDDDDETADDDDEQNDSAKQNNNSLRQGKTPPSSMKRRTELDDHHRHQHHDDEDLDETLDPDDDDPSRVSSIARTEYDGDGNENVAGTRRQRRNV